MKERWTYCLYCKLPWFYTDYMVSETVWRVEAKLKHDAGVCHIDCLEKIIGRQLTIEDFPKHIQSNRNIHFAYEMGRRR
jgi:hypothetical protein